MSTSSTDDGRRRSSGFTANDLALLESLGTTAIRQHRWARTQVVQGPFSDYLAAWPLQAGPGEPPHLTIARFKRTGTYALVVGTQVILTGSSLTRILAATTQVLGGNRREAALA